MARKAKRRGRPPGSKNRRPAGKLNVISTADLRAELSRREGQVGKLQARERELAAELAQVQRELAAFGLASAPAPARRGPGRPPGPRLAILRGPLAAGRKRHQNDSNLEAALAGVLKGKTMGVTEVASAVQAAGYRTTSPNFRTIVNQALIRSNLIKKVSRGQYTAA